MKPSEIVKKSFALAKGFLARDGDGCPVSWKSPKAACFCALGAINKVFGDTNSPKRTTYMKQLAKHISPYVHIATWNDNSTKELVAQTLERVEYELGQEFWEKMCEVS